MKIYAFLCLVMAAVLVVTPALSVAPKEVETTAGKEMVSHTVAGNDDEVIEVMRTAGGNTERVSMEEYLCGAVAGEMPAVYGAEALKAQAVACYTYVLTKEAEGERLTDNPSKNQCYLSKTELKERWGDDFPLYYGKIQDAVRFVKGEYLTFDGKLVKTLVFHAISPGKTLGAERVWGGSAIPYLSPVDSSVDTCSPDYKKTVAIGAGEFSKKLSSVCDIPENSDAKTWVTSVEKSEDGRVESLCVCGTKLTGARFREILGLRSQYFTFTVTGTDPASQNFIITTLGYGHGVGMSQYGAGAMAESGKTYKEILAHYYPGTILQMH